MASTYSSNLKIELMATGENSGTWGTITNTNMGTAVEEAIVGYGNPDYLSDANLTLTISNSNETQTARALVLNVTSGLSLTATRELVVPTAQKPYVVQNNTTGSQSILVKTTAGTGITVPNGFSAYLYTDGTNVVQMADFMPVVRFNSLLGNGGTSVTAILDEDSMASDSATALATQQSIKAYVDAQVGSFDTLAEVLAQGNTTGGTDLAVSAGDDITFTATSNAIFADNGKAIFGAGSDLQIYHDGTTSKIDGNLSVTNALTLSAGTANGVTYLNGSKVLTSGSALTFDGTTFGVNNGVAGGAALSLTGTYSGAGSVAFLNFQRVGGAVAGTLGYNDANNSIQFGTTTNHSTIFLQNNAEAMRLTSTGLGIGTSSPSEKIEVAGNIKLNTTSPNLYFTVSSGTKYNWMVAAQENIDNCFEITPSTTAGGSTFSTPAVVINSSGNLGLGVTPSAWGGGFIGFQIKNSMSLWSGTNSAAYYSNNVYYDGASRKYVYSATAAEYEQGGGIHSWKTAPSGTAGNTIAFNQAMTLDASGNLLVGTTSLPTGGGILTAYSSAAETKVSIVNTGASGRHYWIGSTNDSSGAVGGGKLAIYDQTGNATRLAIDSNGQVGIGVSSPAATLDVRASGVVSQYLISNSGSNQQNQIVSLYNSGAGYGSLNIDGLDLRFRISNSEHMRIDSSGNVGIGTSSPAAKLHVVNTAYIKGSASTDGDKGITISSGSGAVNTSSHAIRTGGGLGDLLIIETETANSSGQIVFNTNSAERMRLDSSGNLGLSVTPSAWYTADGVTRALQISGSGALTANNDAMRVMENAFFNTSGAATYIRSGYAEQYLQNGGQHAWYTAPSGTAGNAISFTQAMTLGADGLLQVGTTTGSIGDGKLQVSATGTGAGAANTVVGLNVFEETSGNKAGLWFGAMTNSNVGVIGSRTASGSIAFQTFNGGWGERLRIDSAGNVGIATSSPFAGAKLTVAGAIMATGAFSSTTGSSGGIDYSGGGLRFFSMGTSGSTKGSFTFIAKGSDNSSSTQMTIDSSGNVIVLGAGSGSLGKLTTRSDGGTPLAVSNESASGTLVALMGNGSGNLGSITHNGSSVAYNTTSDYRLKEDWVAVSNASTRVNALKPVNFAWKADGSRVDGFLAHELAEVVPEAVTGEKDAVDAEGKPEYQGIDQSKLVPLLTAALQEALAKIESLTARVSALEGN
jgi:hypothetical protein